MQSVFEIPRNFPEEIDYAPDTTKIVRDGEIKLIGGGEHVEKNAPGAWHMIGGGDHDWRLVKPKPV